MTRSTGKRTFHIKNARSPDPNVLPINEWSEINRGCYLDFRVWLQTKEYSPATIQTYLVGARFVLGFLKKPYWHIDPLGDTEKVWHYFLKNHPSSSKIDSYRKGLNAFSQYLYEVQNRPVPSKQINWHYYIKGIPNVISSAITDYICHQRHNWGIDRQHKMTITLLSHLTHSLRWMALH